MKRTISLVLCLTMILGLLTGLAAAEEATVPQTTLNDVNFGDTFDLEFEYNGEVYYLGLANPNGPFVEVASGGYPFLYETLLFVTGYYYQVEELTGKQVPLSDQEADLTLAETLTAYLKQKYGKLSIHLYSAVD